MSDLELQQAIRTRVGYEVETRGATAVAEDLGLSRVALMSYLAGHCRAGTRYQVEARARDLRWDE